MTVKDQLTQMLENGDTLQDLNDNIIEEIKQQICDHFKYYVETLQELKGLSGIENYPGEVETINAAIDALIYKYKMIQATEAIKQIRDNYYFNEKFLEADIFTLCLNLLEGVDNIDS